MFERFTGRARQVVVFAQDEARLLRHNYIGTEHLLLGLIREEEGLGARVLDAVGVSLGEVRAQVGRIIGEGEEVRTGQIPFTPRAKKALERALREALSLGHDYIGTEHILLGLASVKDGVAARILLDFGVGADKVRDDVIRLLGGARGGAADERAAERFEPQSPPLAPDVAAELARLSREKEEALQRQEFERAARLRSREQMLVAACRHLIRVWNEGNEST